VVQQAGGLLGGAQAIGLQQDVLQLGIKIGDGSGVVAKGPDSVHKAGSLDNIIWTLSQSRATPPVERRRLRKSVMENTHFSRLSANPRRAMRTENRGPQELQFCSLDLL
jgi:hypothetical protein